MSDGIETLRETVQPKSDQINADTLLAGPITVLITCVRRGSAEQPVEITIEGHLPYRPSKGMRRVLIMAWGDDGRAWAGRCMTLYADPDVKFGGVKVGGIRISHLSHIDADMQLMLTATKGKRAPHLVRRMPGHIAAEQGGAALKAWWSKLSPAEKGELKLILDTVLKPLANAADDKRSGASAGSSENFERLLSASMVADVELLGIAQPEQAQESEGVVEPSNSDDQTTRPTTQSEIAIP